MSETINVYCDESCHLEHDREKAMVIGAIWCPKDLARTAAERIRAIKTEHNLNPRFEVKWTKVSRSKQAFYTALMDYFFSDAGLHFRALVVPDKSKLDHAAHNQTHDDWYYKMYFDLLKVIIDPTMRYRIYLDIKDARGREKVRKLHDVLTNAHYDFSRTIIESIQVIRSHEVELLQLTDLLIGAVAYANRGLERAAKPNLGKVALVEQLRSCSGYSLTLTTLLRESKVNLFHWRATEAEE